MPYKNNKFKDVRNNIDEESELSGAFSSISDTQKYFKYIIKKHKILTEKPSVEISTEFKKELYLELNMGFILSSWHSRLRNDLAILRKKNQGQKW